MTCAPYQARTDARLLLVLKCAGTVRQSLFFSHLPPEEPAMKRTYSSSARGVAGFALLLLLGACVGLALQQRCRADDKQKEAPVIPPREGKRETIKLFNGKDVKGWEGYSHLWSVEDGVIIGKNTEPIKVSTYLLTKRKFSDFRLTATVKLVESEMHSGISFWGRVAPEKGDRYTYAGHLVMFPSDWGMYDLFGRNGLPVDNKPAKKVGKQHDWNDLEILAQGNRVRVAVNGVQ